ncbi:unnamed protein product [Urochloa humidicola]
MPTFLALCDRLPQWVIEELDAIRRNFLWSGKDKATRGRNAAAWPTVCRPTSRGGLGITDLRLSGIALRTRWLWLQKTGADRAWSALDIKVDPEVRAFFDASVTIQVGNGHRTLFWLDKWIDGRSVQHLAPNLFALVNLRRQRSTTVAQGLPNRRWTQDIQGGLSVQATLEYIQLWHRLANERLNQQQDDIYRWRWTADGKYTAASAYLKLQEGNIGLQGAKRIWKSWAPPRVKFFMWLATKGRLWTADRRRRHNLDAHDTCLLCEQEPETSEHILVACPYTKELWWSALTALGRACAFPPEPLSPQDWWNHIRRLQPLEKRKGTDTLAMLLFWSTWKERNRRLFDGRRCQVQELLFTIRQEGHLWVQAGAKHLGDLVSE